MKVTFEFNTSEEDFDKFELEKYKQAPEMAEALENILTQLNVWYNDERGAIPKEEIDQRIWDKILNAGVDLEKMGFRCIGSE